MFAIALALSFMFPSAGWASDDLSSPVNDVTSNQEMSQSASLVAPDPEVKIEVYLQPEANKKKVGYGVNGDAVTVLEQVSGNQSVVWNHIRFEGPSSAEEQAEGWVQSSFLKPEEELDRAMESQQVQSQNRTQNQGQGRGQNRGQNQRQKWGQNQAGRKAGAERYLGNSQEVRENERSQLEWKNKVQAYSRQVYLQQNQD